MVASSALYAPLRTHGAVATGPLALHTQGNSSMIAAAVEHSFIVYSTDRLHILYTGPPLPGPISHMIWVKRVLVFSISNSVYSWTPGSQTTSVVLSSHAHIASLLSLNTHFLSYSTDGTLNLYELSTTVDDPSSSRQQTFSLHHSHSTTPNGTCLLHPPGLVNKVIIGGDCFLNLVNFKTGKVIYSFDSALFPSSFVVNSLAQSPCTSVIAVAFSPQVSECGEEAVDDVIDDVITGPQVALINIFSGEVVLRSSLPFTGIKMIFRTDNSPLLHVLTANTRLITINLKERTSEISRIVGLPKTFEQSRQHLRDGQAYSDLVGINGRPLLIFSGYRILSVLVFEDSINPRVLRHRLGTSSNPNVIIPLFELDTSAGTRILTFSSGSPLELSLVASHQSRFWSTESSLPPCLDAAMGRSQEWPSVVSIHEGESRVRVWDSKSGIEVKSIKINGQIDCVDVSNRSEFVAVSHSNVKGSTLEIYRLQSRLKSFEVKLPSSIIALNFDLLNKFVFCAGVDGNLYIVDLSSKSIKTSIKLGATITSMTSCSQSNLIGVSTIEGRLLVFDTFRQALIRDSKISSRAPISSMTFNATSSALICGSLFGEFFVFDLVTSSLIDAFIATSNGQNCPINGLLTLDTDSIISIHAGKSALYEWYSRQKYEVLSRRKVETMVRVSLPGEEESGHVMDDVMIEENEGTVYMSEKDVITAFEEIAASQSDLIGFTNDSRTWKDLPMYDVIKSRHQPVVPAKTPTAPFFLDFKQKDESTMVPKVSKISGLSKNSSVLGRMINNDVSSVIPFLQSQNISFVFSLFASISTPLYEGDDHEIDLLMEFFINLYSQSCSVKIDLIESWLACFLKHHASHVKDLCPDKLDLLVKTRKNTISKSFNHNLMESQALIENALGLLVI
ncbi:hypothetical protein P9112_009163 [Eukaryota sp. TZLM1-RC]